MVYLLSFASSAAMYGASSTAEFRLRYFCPPGGCAADEAPWLVACGLAVPLLSCLWSLFTLARRYRECVSTGQTMIAITKAALLAPSSMALLPPLAICCVTIAVIADVFVGS
jgi:hypothetical protein